MRNLGLLVFGVAVLAVVVAILFPVFWSSYTPAWAEASGSYLKDIGYALSDYSLDHNGALPSTLADLYPGYTRDKRVRDASVMFGRTKMIVIYYRPARLGDRGTPVAEIRLYPTMKTKYEWRGFVLWGDRAVRLRE